jgi:hypothetical protein
MMILSPGKTASSGPLAGLRVGIAGAVPERQYWKEVWDLDRLILTFVAQLAALVVRFGGRVVHGSQPLLTPVVAEQTRRQARQETGALTLFASQLFGALPAVTERAARLAEAEVVLTRPVGKGDSGDRETRNRSLTAMRLAMTEEIDVLVAVGGKLHLDTGFNPGVLEELAQARWRNVPCFIVGAFGGVAGQLELPVIEELSAGNLLEASTLSVAMAMWSSSMDEHVGKLLAHFARHKEQFIRKGQAESRSTSIASSIRPEAFPVSGFKTPMKVVTVDAAVVEGWSARFSELLGAIQGKDADLVLKLLSTQNH